MIMVTNADLRGAYRPYDPPAGWAPDAAGYLYPVAATEAAQ